MKTIIKITTIVKTRIARIVATILAELSNNDKNKKVAGRGEVMASGRPRRFGIERPAAGQPASSGACGAPRVAVQGF